jgi:hypothetical protein
MDATRISSTPAVVGVVSSAASMPRILKSQRVSLLHYRQAQVDRHLREYLQRGADGRYFSVACLNLYELVFHCMCTEHYISYSVITAVVADVQLRLRARSQPLSESQLSFRLFDISEVQRQAIKEALAGCDEELSQLTRREKQMAWFDHPDWLAEDSTVAAELHAADLARRVATMSY